jgi:hypothetical protein
MMSHPQSPKPAKLLISLITGEKALFQPAATHLSERFGEPDMISQWFSFHYTDYYRTEMGSPLFRRMMGFHDLIAQGDLSRIKCTTNEIESLFSHGAGRRVNIDPGYLLHERFVLATGKNFSHRIYIGRGIYADLTLIYTRGEFQPLAWTYPDYRSEEVIGFLQSARKKYTVDLNAANEPPAAPDGKRAPLETDYPPTPSPVDRGDAIDSTNPINR